MDDLTAADSSRSWSSQPQVERLFLWRIPVALVVMSVVGIVVALV